MSNADDELSYSLRHTPAASKAIACISRVFGSAPSLEEIDALARRALQGLPRRFTAPLKDIVLTVEDFADEETLETMGIEDPFELTGLYQGIPLGEKQDVSVTMPDRIRLFRQPILDEWIERQNETLERLVAHVLIHEVGHHFGLTDDDMHALEEEA